MKASRPFLTTLLVLAGACSSSGSQDQGSSGSSGGTSSSGSSSGASGTSSGSGSSSGTSGSSGSGSGSGGSSGSTSGSGSGSTSGSSGDDGGGPSDAGGEPDVWANPVDGGPMGTGPVVMGTVTVNPAMTTGQVAPGFVGLSYEKSHLTDSFFTATNAPLIAMLKLLGPSVLRIGGNSVDATTWQASAPPTTGGTIGTTIGTADVDNLRDFLDATGWTTIYAVGLKHSTPDAAGTEAAYAAKTLGSLLYGFEIGNEIDLYGLSASQLEANWSAEARAIQMKAPGAKLTAPAMAAHAGVVGFAAAEASFLSMLTQHHYIGDGHGSNATMATMLGPDNNLPPVLSTLTTAVANNHIADGWRMDETNSFYNHGAPGVSNTLGSALWVLDYMFNVAAGGAAGVNFHGGGPGQDGSSPFLYTPIEEANGAVTGAQPIFYGMLMFTLAGTGKLLQTTATAGTLNFSAYAVSGAGGATNVVLVNKDATSAVHASVDVGATASSAGAIYLQGPSLTALTGVTLAGAGISPAGAWSPGAPFALATAGQVVTVDVPAASAALVHVQ